MTRRTGVSRKGKPPKEKPAVEEPEKEVSQQPPGTDAPEDAPASSTRPRRTLKKNVLYHNSDYDLDPSSKLSDEPAAKSVAPSRAVDPKPKINQPVPRLIVRKATSTLSGPLVYEPLDSEEMEYEMAYSAAEADDQEELLEQPPVLDEPMPLESEAAFLEPQAPPELVQQEKPKRKPGPGRPAKAKPRARKPAAKKPEAEEREAEEPETEEPAANVPEASVPETNEPEKAPSSNTEEPESSSKPAIRANTVPKRPIHLPDSPKGYKKRKIPTNLSNRVGAGETRKEKDPTIEEEPLDQMESLEPVELPPVQGPLKLDDIVYADGADLVVGAEFEVANEDDGPPVLGPSVVLDAEQQPVEAEEDDGASDDDNDDTPPSLEKQQTIKKRGRPPREKPEKEEPLKVRQNRSAARMMRMAIDDQIAKAAATSNQRNIKLFESELETTPQGDNYATVISGCLAELLRKDRIIDLLTNPEEVDMIRNGGWMLNRPPRLPPLTDAKVCFAFYVDGSKVTNPRDLSNDDLRPWSTQNDPLNPQSCAVKANVRRHPVSRQDGKLLPCKVLPKTAELHLTEYSARLPRAQRLRKKIFYLSRDNQIYGNVLILYDYTCTGAAPSVLPSNGSDPLQNALIDEDLADEDASPFERNPIEGPRGGIYLKLRPSKLGWVHNKILLLDYMFNRPELIEMNLLNERPPNLPPLIEGMGVFVYFVPASMVANQLHHAGDGLSPWTIIPNAPIEEQKALPRVRSTRRPLEQASTGRIGLARDSRYQCDLVLIETMSTLARCRRIRKRVIYIQQLYGSILGNVIYVYEFLADGALPVLYNSQKMQHRWSSKMGMQQKKITLLETQQDLLVDDTFFEDDIGMEIIEEEIIGTVMDIDENGREGMIQEHLQDTLDGGHDTAFPDELTEKDENPDPFYELSRHLESGHAYLTIRHKKIASSFDTVLDWIVNTNIVEERGILNSTKPGHPPIVCNARAYAFFVAGTAIFPHDVNRDDFSPWSHNGNTENPTCYRTKVRKLGAACDTDTNRFYLRDTDYKGCPFHLVFLYSINPRDPRLRKKIFYLMETQSKMIVSHGLIIYDYNNAGDLPHLNNGGFKGFVKRNNPRQAPPYHDVYNDVDETIEEERECPFAVPPEEAIDGTLYMQVIDTDFWNDRNRQLHFLVNKPQLVVSMGCLNNKVPDLPPASEQKSCFVFFVNGDEVNFRQLTGDRLGPWSENSCSSTSTVMKRPKTTKVPLGLNRKEELRVWRANVEQTNTIEFQLHIYTATLPRCTRLRKKVIYVLKDGRQVGYAMIMYSYTDSGPVPQPIQRGQDTAEAYLEKFTPNVRTHIVKLLKTLSPSEVAKTVFEEHGVVVNAHMLYYIRRQELNSAMEPVRFHGEVGWTNADGTGPSTSAANMPMIEEGPCGSNIDMDMIPDGAMIVEHTEIVEEEVITVAEQGERRSHFLDGDANTNGFIRGHQRHDALWRIAQKSFNTKNGLETFDELFRYLLDKNEHRLLQQVNRAFNVDIFPSGGWPMEMVEEVVELIPPPEDEELPQ